MSREGKAKPRRAPEADLSDPEQSRRFVEMARELGGDVTEEEFERAFARVAAAPRVETAKAARGQGEEPATSRGKRPRQRP